MATPASAPQRAQGVTRVPLPPGRVRPDLAGNELFRSAHPLKGTRMARPIVFHGGKKTAGTWRLPPVVATLDDDCERGGWATSARSRRIAQPCSGQSAADSPPVC